MKVKTFSSHENREDKYFFFYCSKAISVECLHCIVKTKKGGASRKKNFSESKGKGSAVSL